MCSYVNGMCVRRVAPLGSKLKRFCSFCIPHSKTRNSVVARSVRRAALPRENSNTVIILDGPVPSSIAQSMCRSMLGRFSSSSLRHRRH